jgi:hypothetical protein
MSIIFPSFIPSQREFTLGVHATNAYRSLSGAVSKRSFGNKPYSYKLSLEFTNVTDDITFGIFDHYEATFGGFSRFSLPLSLFNGISDPLVSRMRSPSNILWEYEAPPVVQSVHTGISTVSVSLIGELDVDALTGSGLQIVTAEPVYSYESFGNILVTITFEFNQTGVRRRCDNNEIVFEFDVGVLSITGQYSGARFSVATQRFSPSLAPIGLLPASIKWIKTCDAVDPGGANGPFLSMNGVFIQETIGVGGSPDETNISGLWGGNSGTFNDSSYEFNHYTKITQIVLRSNVPGLGVIGDDITAKGLEHLYDPSTQQFEPAPQTVYVVDTYVPSGPV